MSGREDSDLELVTRLKDVSRPKPVKCPASRHVVNPNFMFFCQIVLLVIPISVLYAGLYFMNISSRAIVLICGAIVFAILCIFLFVRPFKLEDCDEKKPLRQNCGYSSIKPVSPVECPMKSAVTKHGKRPGVHRGIGVDTEIENKDRCSPHVILASADSLSSVSTSSVPGIAVQTQATTAESPVPLSTPDERCRCCLMGRKGPPFREDPQCLKSIRDSNGGTSETMECSIQVDHISASKSLGIIDEEDTRPLGAPSPCSEKTSCSAKLLIPNVDLSNASLTSSNHSINNTPRLDNSRQPNLCQSFAGGTAPHYTSMRTSSGMKSDMKNESISRSSRKTRSPHRSENTLTCPSTAGSHQMKTSGPSGRSKFVTRTNNIGPPNYNDNVTSQSSATVSAEISNDLSTVPHKDEVTDHTTCSDKICSFLPQNHSGSNVYKPQLINGKISTDLLSGIPVENPSKQRKKYSCRNKEHELTDKAEHQIMVDGTKVNLRKNTTGSEFQPFTFPPCPSDKAVRKDRYSPSNLTKAKQPILIKLFPTSSKDGVFSWEPNPVKPNEPAKGPNNKTRLTSTDTPHFSSTADGHVQTPEIIDTQASADYSIKGKRVHFCVPEVPEKDGPYSASGVSAHQATSESIVDFVLRPFSKGVSTGNKNIKNDDIINKRSKKYTSEKHIASSTFDLLKIQSSCKTDSYRFPEKIRAEANCPNNTSKLTKQDEIAEFDLCSIYYSSIHSKLYQPSKSGLLVTESSKEEVGKLQRLEDLPKIKMTWKHKRNIARLESNQKFAERHTKQDNRIDGTGRNRTKRKSDDEENIASKCANHGGILEDTSALKGLTPPKRQKADYQRKTQSLVNSEQNKLSLMSPHYNFVSSGRCDKETMVPSNLCSQEPKDLLFHKRKPPGFHGKVALKNQRNSRQVETNFFKKSSHSYRTVTIDEVMKPKKKMPKKSK